MRFIKGLQTWVEEMQVSLMMCISFKLAICMSSILKSFLFLILKLQLGRSEWGNDLPSVEAHMNNHSGVHRDIEEFQMSLKDAKLSEVSASSF